MDMFEDESESDCGPEFGRMSPESIRIKKKALRGCYTFTILYMIW